MGVPSRPVPAEFLGLARVFREAVKQVDRRLDALIDTIAQPLHARLARHPALRPEQPMAVVRAWGQTVPAALRIGRPPFASRSW
jgi:hypothetical protein